MTAGALLDRDRAARRAAQIVFDRPLVLEAGAGTGKTTTLVARLLSWTLGPGWVRSATDLGEGAAERGEAPPGSERVAARVLDRVVAITFTEAAAAEMATRAARELATLAAGDAPPEWLDPDGLPEPEPRRTRAAALLATLDHLQVSTIHAFCLGLLSAHPIEAGLHPRLTVDADGRRVEAVVHEVVEAALRNAYGDPPDPAFLTLAARGKGPPEIVAALIGLIDSGVPAAALAADPLAGAAAALLEPLAAAIRSVHALVAPRLGGSRRRLGLAVKLCDALGRLAADSELGRIGATPRSLRLLSARLADELPENLRKRLAEWGRKGSGSDTEAKRFADCVDELKVTAGELARLVATASRLDPELLTAAREALGPLLARVEGELIARGISSFNQLLSGAADLLARHRAVRARLQRRIDQLLVDEFQDTDRLQCELIRWLALDGPDEQRPGLFLVGDPKQSIYGWRSADLAAYDAFLERVAAAGGEVHPLVENFRSVPAILAEVERAIEPVMREERGLQPRFEPLLACERRRDETGFTGGGRAPVEYWVSRPADGGAEAAARLEAAAMARDLVDLHRARGVPWRKAGVLLRSVGDLDIYLEALRERGVPFAVARDRNYYRRREVIEATALVRAVLDPGDHVAMLTLLRSTMVGVPDAALIPLWRHQLPRRLTRLGAGDDPGDDSTALEELSSAVRAAAGELPSTVPGLAELSGWPTALLAAAEHLALARRSFRAAPFDRFVATLRHLFLPEPIEAARYLGPYRLANLDRFFTRLLGVFEEGGGDTAAVLRTLRRSVAEAPDAQEARPDEAAEDAVQVMTIHTAKGLDFDHVYLVQLHKEPGGDRNPPVAAAQLADGWEYRLFGAPTPGFHRAEAQRDRVEKAEQVRTLYVAMTRARDRLVLAGRWEDDPRARPPEGARNHLELLVHRRDRPDLAELWSEGALDGAADATGVLWRLLPAVEEVVEPPAEAAPDRPALPEPAEIERQAAAIAVLRREAMARSARRFSTTASADAHRLLRQLAAEAEGDEEQGAGAPQVGRRDAALAAGAAVHRALEMFDTAADADEEVARQRARLADYVAEVAPSDTGEGRDQAAGPALARAIAAFDRFAAGDLCPRLRALDRSIVARELPVLLPPPAAERFGGDRTAIEGSAGDAEGPPVGFVAGTLDLLYRDPATGTLVVADYKTDQVAEARELVERYRGQGELYAAAVRDGLGLAEEVHFEIWSLHLGRVIPVEGPPAAPAASAPAAPAAEDQLHLFPEE